MNIYIASRYGRMEEMAQNADKLVKAGARISSRWVYGGTENMTQEQGAIADFEDVVKADMVLVFTEGPLTSPHESLTGGHHVEFGMAVALNKRVALVGPRVNIFHHLPMVQTFDTLKAFLNALKKEIV